MCRRLQPKAKTFLDHLEAAIHSVMALRLATYAAASTIGLAPLGEEVVFLLRALRTGVHPN